MIQYPADLPCGLREGYGFQPVSPVARTEMQSGRARQRRRFTSVPTVATIAWIFTVQQAQLFESWFEGVLLSGSQWFEGPFKTPIGTRNFQARFVDIYQGPTLVGLEEWRYAAKLELFERPIVSGDWALILPEYILQSDIIDRAANREWPAL